LEHFQHKHQRQTDLCDLWINCDRSVASHLDIAFMNQATNNSMMDFVRAAYVNAATASLSNDLFLLAGAACVFMAIEGRRIGLRYVWLYILLSGLIAISVTFPLFLLMRHLKLIDREFTAEPAKSV
jgi:hypothetical protein